MYVRVDIAGWRYVPRHFRFSRRSAAIDRSAPPCGPCLGAPSVVPYLEKWTRRDSFFACYQHRNLFTATMVVPMANMIASMAGDVTDDGATLKVVLDRARELVGADRAALFFVDQVCVRAEPRIAAAAACPRTR